MEPRDAAEPARWWTWPTTVGFVLVAAGSGIYLAFASEQADRENAGEVVSTGIRTAVAVGGVLLLGGFLALIVEGVRRGRREGRLGRRVAGEVGMGFLGMIAGLFVMLAVVHIAFA
jgi:hypothetical protein